MNAFALRATAGAETRAQSWKQSTGWTALDDACAARFRTQDSCLQRNMGQSEETLLGLETRLREQPGAADAAPQQQLSIIRKCEAAPLLAARAQISATPQAGQDRGLLQPC
jgi:hypothetical protein